MLSARRRDWICDQIKQSGLRGRGGAGFSTGLKWTFMPKQESDRPHYLLVNADESEPGTCKDREIMRQRSAPADRRLLIACKAMQAHTAYIYIRGEYVHERERLLAAIKQAYDAKLIGKGNVHGWDFDVLRPPRRRGLYLRRGNRPAGKPGRQEGPAASEAAVPGRRGRLWLPDHGQQRRDHRCRRHHPAPRRRLVRPASAGRASPPAPSCSPAQRPP